MHYEGVAVQRCYYGNTTDTGRTIDNPGYFLFSQKKVGDKKNIPNPVRGVEPIFQFVMKGWEKTKTNVTPTILIWFRPRSNWRREES